MIYYEDLLVIMIVSLSFVLLFKFQKKIFSPQYFANSQLVTGSNVTYKMLLGRYIIIFLFGLLSYFFIKDQSIVIIGTFLGSFLIVWPVLLNPVQTYSYPYSNFLIGKKEKTLIFILHIIFIITSVLTVYIAIESSPAIENYIIDSWRNLVISIFLKLIALTFFGSTEGYLSKLIDKEIREKSDLNDYPGEKNE